LTGILIVATVLALLLGLFLLVSWGLEGLEGYYPTCNLSNGSCYPSD
ncbi:hypothetical protein LCGC14_2277440, partial [marine sediment metagenome]